MRQLDCSIDGDKRFCSLTAKVMLFGELYSIESHLILCERFGKKTHKSRKNRIHKTPTHISIQGREYVISYLEAFRKLLWCKYLGENPKLVEYAKQFTHFYDSTNQFNADIIERYVKQGKGSVLDDCVELALLMLNIPDYSLKLVEVGR